MIDDGLEPEAFREPRPRHAASLENETEDGIHPLALDGGLGVEHRLPVLNP